jgi:hypothetical protein
MVATAEDSGKLFMYDFDHLLARSQALQHFGAQGTLFDPGHKVPGHPEINIGLQQRTAHLSQGLIYVFLRQAALGRKAIEDSSEFFCQVFKHC